MISIKTPVNELARQVRATYLLKRGCFVARFKKDGFDLPSPWVLREWDGLNPRRAGIQESIWEKIARFAAQHHVDPVHLVKACFWNWTEFQPPLPQELLRPQLIEEARNYEANRREELGYKVTSWATQAQTQFYVNRRFRRDLPDEYHWRCVISSPEISLGPLFRYCLAHSAGLHDTAKFYFDDALGEYMTDPDSYDVALEDVLPAAFCEAARQRLHEIYEHLGT